MASSTSQTIADTNAPSSTPDGVAETAASKENAASSATDELNEDEIDDMPIDFDEGEGTAESAEPQPESDHLSHPYPTYSFPYLLSI